MTNPESADLPTSLLISGQRRELRAPSWLALLDLLRERPDPADSKKGCDHGQRGACAVLRSGRRISTRLTLVAACDSDALTTIEGLVEGDRLHPLQQAFIHHNAFQCGYCTSGQICSVLSPASEGWARSRAEICEGMSGSLCRHGTYGNILDAMGDTLPLPDHDGQGGQHA